jgi:hypothetical protein
MLGAGCVNVRVAEVPPPDNDCPTEADVEELAELIPYYMDVAEAIRVEALAGRFIDAAAYCVMAEKRLR